MQARQAASLGSRAREQLAQQLARAASPLGDEGDALHGARTPGLRADCVPRGNAEKRTPVLSMAVAVAVTVVLAARVSVAALVNCNAIVRVIDAAIRGR